MTELRAIIFDLGGVLIDWNPRYVYREVFDSEEKVEWFLSHICSMDWNEQQDAGSSIAKGIEEKVAEFPEWEKEIRIYYDRWTDMLAGPIPGTVAVLRELKKDPSLKLYALTNWSAELFPVALQRYDFLHWFEGIVVSGVEKCRKPLPEFFQILFDRYQVEPSRSLFIDDNLANIKGAQALGMNAIAFKDPERLTRELSQWNIKVFA